MLGEMAMEKNPAPRTVGPVPSDCPATARVTGAARSAVKRAAHLRGLRSGAGATSGASRSSWLDAPARSVAAPRPSAPASSATAAAVDASRPPRAAASTSPATAHRPRSLTRTQRRVAAVAVGLVALAVLGIACWRYLPGIYAWLSNAGAVRTYVAEHAILARLAIVGINVLQVLLAFFAGRAGGACERVRLWFLGGDAPLSRRERDCLYGHLPRSPSLGMARSGALFRAREARALRLARQYAPAGARHAHRVSHPRARPKTSSPILRGSRACRYLPVFAITTLGRIPSIVTSTVAASAFGDGNLRGCRDRRCGGGAAHRGGVAWPTARSSAAVAREPPNKAFRARRPAPGPPAASGCVGAAATVPQPPAAPSALSRPRRAQNL